MLLENYPSWAWTNRARRDFSLTKKLAELELVPECIATRCGLRKVRVKVMFNQNADREMVCCHYHTFTIRDLKSGRWKERAILRALKGLRNPFDKEDPYRISGIGKPGSSEPVKLRSEQ